MLAHDLEVLTSCSFIFERTETIADVFAELNLFDAVR